MKTGIVIWTGMLLLFWYTMNEVSAEEFAPFEPFPPLLQAEQKLPRTPDEYQLNPVIRDMIVIEYFLLPVIPRRPVVILPRVTE